MAEACRLDPVEAEEPKAMRAYLTRGLLFCLSLAFVLIGQSISEADSADELVNARVNNAVRQLEAIPDLIKNGFFDDDADLHIRSMVDSFEPAVRRHPAVICAVADALLWCDVSVDPREILVSVTRRFPKHWDSWRSLISAHELKEESAKASETLKAFEEALQRLGTPADQQEQADFIAAASARLMVSQKVPTTDLPTPDFKVADQPVSASKHATRISDVTVPGSSALRKGIPQQFLPPPPRRPSRPHRQLPASNVRSIIQSIEQLTYRIRETSFDQRTRRELNRLLKAQPRDLIKHPAVVCAAALSDFDRGTDPTRELRQLLARSPAYWPAWRLRIASELVFGHKSAVQGSLQRYHEAVLRETALAPGRVEQLRTEVAYIWDVVDRLSELQYVTGSTVKDIKRHPGAVLLMASNRAQHLLAEASYARRTVAEGQQQMANLDRSDQISQMNDALDALESKLAAAVIEHRNARQRMEDEFLKLQGKCLDAHSELLRVEVAKQKLHEAAAPIVRPTDINAIEKIRERVAANEELDRLKIQTVNIERKSANAAAHLNFKRNEIRTSTETLLSVIKSANEELTSLERRFAGAIRHDQDIASRIQRLKQRLHTSYHTAPNVATMTKTFQNLSRRTESARHLVGELGFTIESAFEMLRRSPVPRH